MIWQLQDAKRKFSQLVNHAIKDGPQIVTRQGQEVVVILSMDDYQRMIQPKPSLLALLLDSPLVGSGLEINHDQNDFGREVA
jgi:prevent-host-death family protein